jgi:hypothetical protein
MGRTKGASLVVRLAYLGAALAAASALALTSPSGASAQGDVIFVAPDSGTPITDIVEGSSTGDTLVGQFVDTANLAGDTCDNHYAATIHWGDGQSSAGTITCDGTLPIPDTQVVLQIFNVNGSHRYADSGDYAIHTSVSDTTHHSASGSDKTDTAQISDAGIGLVRDNQPEGGFVGVEGAPVSITVDFADRKGESNLDPGISVTVNWGDGSSAQKVTPTPEPADCSCSVFRVSAAHNYDANKPTGGTYAITVDVKDDGGSTQTDKMSASVSDAALTPGSGNHLTATATKSFTAPVANFIDAAGSQASKGDFAATIKWGDNTTSSGTVSAGSSAGSFNVSGTHTYSSSGSRTLTITVTDEEGQTVTMTATATVGAAPVVLPQTGEPGESGPASSLGFLALAWLGLSSLAVGVVRLRAKKA